MSSPNIPNDIQNQHQQQQQQNVQGGFICPRCSSYYNLCHRCLSFSSIYNLRYYCNNCRRPPWTLPTGRQAHNITTGNINGNKNRRNRRLTVSASSSTALPAATSSAPPATAATTTANAGPSSSMFTASEPTLSNWLRQPSMLPPVVQIPRPPTLPQQQISNIFQIFPRPPALPQQQNPNMGITVTINPAVCLDLSLRPPERSSNISQQRPLPFDLNMAPPPDS